MSNETIIEGADDSVAMVVFVLLGFVAFILKNAWDNRFVQVLGWANEMFASYAEKHWRKRSIQHNCHWWRGCVLHLQVAVMVHKLATPQRRRPPSRREITTWTDVRCALRTHVSPSPPTAVILIARRASLASGIIRQTYSRLSRVRCVAVSSTC
jgi:hypothetical protein